MTRLIIWTALAVVGLCEITACSYQDPALDRDIDKYRGSGIQRDGDRMPRRIPANEAN